MSQLSLVSTIALQRAIEQLSDAFARQSGCALKIEWAATAPLIDRIRAGERADVAVLTEQGALDLAQAGILLAPGQPGGVVPLVRSYIGVAVKAGAPHPDISSFDAFVNTLLTASSIAYSKAGASGLHMKDFLEKNGIAELVNARATVLAQGFTSALAASGQVQLAIQQVSELLSVEGIEIVGRLPEGAQSPSIFSAGVFKDSALAGTGAAFLDFLRSAQARPVLERCGLEPL
jgi:molybdate transport system substrate-binding protein